MLIDSITDDEKLALLIALQKELKPKLDALKAKATAEALRQYESEGIERRALKVNGVKVGDIAVTRCKESVEIPEYDEEALKELYSRGLARLMPTVGWQNRFSVINGEIFDKKTGEAVTWLKIKPEHIKCATVRGCAPKEVKEAFSERLTGLDARYLLEDE